jgi:cytochrome b
MPAPTNSVEPSDPTARPGRVLVWDLPVRIFHALLAGSFLLAWGIAVTSDDESRRFAFHALLGLFIGALVVFRVVWGVIGTRYARFSGFATRPAALAAYLKGILLGPEREFVGHNPASSYATFAMLVLLAGLIGTGLMLGGGNESVEDLHELFAHAMLAVVGIHVLGVILHTVRHRDPIALGMLDGRKRGAPGTAIRSARPGSACCSRRGPAACGRATTPAPAPSRCPSSAPPSRSARSRTTRASTRAARTRRRRTTTRRRRRRRRRTTTATARASAAAEGDVRTSTDFEGHCCQAPGTNAISRTAGTRPGVPRPARG